MGECNLFSDDVNTTIKGVGYSITFKDGVISLLRFFDSNWKYSIPIEESSWLQNFGLFLGMLADEQEEIFIMSHLL